MQGLTLVATPWGGTSGARSEGVAVGGPAVGTLLRLGLVGVPGGVLKGGWVRRPGDSLRGSSHLSAGLRQGSFIRIGTTKGASWPRRGVVGRR